MVDLAYWSDFDTSRRDAASAFATLSMNGDCVPMRCNVGGVDSVAVVWVNTTTKRVVFRANNTYPQHY